MGNEHSLIGQTVGSRYKITGVLGRGGMGEVFEALDNEAGLPVALKILLPHRESADNRERFLREARASMRLEHPNVVRVYGAGETPEGSLFLAMELLTGHDLKTQLKRALLPLETALRFGVAVCEALSAAHAMGIVHRDLKPANLFLCDGDPLSVKILDFGLARLDGEDLSLTQSGAILGTPAYMSPEQARGEDDVDERADVYSLAVTLYESLTGHLPFEAGNRAAMLLKVLRDLPTPIRKHRADLSPKIEAFFTRALARERADRFSNAKAMAAGLRDCLHESGIEPHKDSDPRSSTTIEERRLVAIFAAEEVTGNQPLDAARRESGWAERILGERCIALFGLEGSFGDEAARAVRAALESRDSFSCACVATAKVELTAAGPILEPLLDSVFRLLATTDEKTIVVDSETYRQIRGRFDAQETADGLWVITRERPQAHEIKVREVMGVQTPTVGREAELAQLYALCSRLLEERQPLAVTMVGPAGVGKSRLRYELASHLESRPEDFLHLYGRGEPLHASTPFSLFADMFKQRGQITEGAPLEEKQKKLREVVAWGFPNDPSTAEKTTQVLGVLLSISFPKSEVQRALDADPESKRAAIEDAILGFLRGVARSMAPVLFFEDIHFSDDASLALLEQLLWRCQGAPILCALFARPEFFEERPQLFAGYNHVRLDVKPLGKRAIERLVASILGAEPPAALTDFLVERAGGIPFFVEELLWAFRERGLLEATPSGWFLLQDPHAANLPHSIEGVLQARLDQLPQVEKELLKRASIFGDFFWEDGLSQLGVVDPASTLRRLRSRELIVPRSPSMFQGTAEFSFRHALLREVSYSILPEAEKRWLHLQAADWLRSHSERDATVAWHLDLGGDAYNAAHTYSRAGDLARDAYAFPEALRCYQRALELLTEEAPERFGIVLSSARLCRHMGQWQQAKQSAQEACALAGDDPVKASRAYAMLATSAKDLQEHELAEQALRAALEHARRSKDPAIEGDVLTTTAFYTEEKGDRAQAKAYVERALQIFGDSPLYIRQRGNALKTLGRLERRAGRLNAAREAFQQALAIARSCDDRPLEAEIFNSLGIIAHCALELDEALRCYQHAAQLADGAGLSGMKGRVQGNIGQLYLSLGQLNEAASALDSAVLWSRENSYRVGLADCLSHSALVRLSQGKVEQAIQLAQEGVAFAKAVADPYHLGHATCALGECLLVAYQTRADLDRVIQFGREAREIGRNGGLPDVVLRGLVLCARAYSAAGEEAAARGEAAAALRVSSQGGPELLWIIEAHLCYYDLVSPHAPEEARGVLQKAKELVDRQAAGIRNEALRASFLMASPQRDVITRAKRDRLIDRNAKR